MTMDADPTLGADIEGTETQSIYAWANEEDNTEFVVQQRWSWKLPIAAAALTVAAALTAAAVLVWPHHSGEAASPASPASPMATAPVPPQIVSPPAQTQQTSVAAQEMNPDERFVAVLKAQGWVFSVPDSEVAVEGHEVCQNMADGVTYEQEVSRTAAASGIEKSHAIRFITTATDILCPQYSQP